MEHLDLYLFHWPMPALMPDTWRAMVATLREDFAGARTRVAGLELAERLFSHVQKEEMSLLPLLEDLLEPQADELRHHAADDRPERRAEPLRGLHDPSLLGALAELPDGLAGVRWVDKTAEVSRLLGRYRHAMTWLLVAAHAIVYGVLWWRLRRLAWRAALPTLIATGLTLGILGWIGQPFQLFNVLALVLLLGIGVDYGIFLVEHDGDGSAWLAVALGAASTWLSFGLLGLSSTPALRAFGLTLLFGIVLVWGLAPMFRLPVSARSGAPPASPPLGR